MNGLQYPIAANRLRFYPETGTASLYPEDTRVVAGQVYGQQDRRLDLTIRTAKREHTGVCVIGLTGSNGQQPFPLCGVVHDALKRCLDSFIDPKVYNDVPIQNITTESVRSAFSKKYYETVLGHNLDCITDYSGFTSKGPVCVVFRNFSWRD